MSEGALLLGQGGQYFECSHEHGTGDHCLSFHYTPEFVEQCGMAPFRIPRIPALPQLSSLTVLAALGVVSPELVNFDEMAKNLVCTVGEILSSSRSRGCAAPAADERRISAVLRFIEAHTSEPLPIRLLASAAKVSEFHFLRMFRNVTGLTPHQYILRMRMRQAAIRLASQADNIVAVAAATGFGDLSNFNHLFRTEFGLSPRTFRSRLSRA
jgi:AraC-like DNA-binding protein